MSYGLFGLADALDEAGWMKVLSLEGYAARSRIPPEALQQALFLYQEAQGVTSLSRFLGRSHSLRQYPLPSSA